MTDCDYRPDGDALACPHCGDRRAKFVRRNCPGRSPSLVAKATSYAIARGRWELAGRPVRSEAEVLEILAVCRGGDGRRRCERFDPASGTCNACGCPVNDGQEAVENKAKMATEDCPLGKWGGRPLVIAPIGEDAIADRR